MKVLMLTDRMDVGGAETHVAQLIRGLSSFGVRITLLSGGGRFADQLEREGIPQWIAPLPCRKLLRLWRLRREIRQRVKQEGFDILHAHARIPAQLIRGCRRWKNPDGSHPVGIVTAHAHFASSGLLPYLCHWGDFTVAVSEDLRRYLLSVYHLPAERIRVIENGVDCEHFSPDFSVKKPGQEQPAILFVSRLDSDCSLGAELLLSLAPSLCRDYPALCITLVGGGSEEAALRRKAQSINKALMYEAVRLCGRVSELPLLLREHQIFVGVSRAAMEAAACGLAVVLCGNEGYGGILQEENALSMLCSNLSCRGQRQGNATCLEQDLRRLLSNPSLREECGAFCRSFATEACNAEAMCRKHLALYHRVRCQKKDLLLTVGGYFGCRNLGDDAILEGLLEVLALHSPSVGLLALTEHPCASRRRFGIPCLGRRNPLAIRAAFLVSDAFLCGGGSLLQNLTSRRSLYYYLGLLRTARSMGCPPILFAAGIGPLLGRNDLRRTRATLQKCPYIGLRDEDSRKQLGALGIDPARLHVGADPAVFLPSPPRGRASSLLQELGIPEDRPLFCVVLRDCNERELPLHLIPAAVRALCAKRGLTPLFLCFDRRNDREISLLSAKAANALLLTPEEAADAEAILGRASAVLTMRLHAMILATRAGTPALGIPADPRDKKIKAFAKSAGQEVLPLFRVSVTVLVDLLEEMLESASARRPILLQSLAEMRKNARKDLANILQMIYNKGDHQD